jgi:hypothetical protein
MMVEDDTRRGRSLTRSDQVALVVVAAGILIVTALLVALLF